jgi:hypothetical protein
LAVGWVVWDGIVRYPLLTLTAHTTNGELQRGLFFNNGENRVGLSRAILARRMFAAYEIGRCSEH